MTKTGLSGWRAAHLGQRQNRAEGHHLVAEPCRRICVRDAGGCLAGSIINPMVESMGLSWQQGPLSTGAIGRFLVPEPLPKRLLYVERSRWRMRVRASGGSESRIASSRARRWFRTVQTATSTSARWSMSRWRAGGGCERLGSTFGPHQSGAGHGATSVGECRTSA